MRRPVASVALAFLCIVMHNQEARADLSPGRLAPRREPPQPKVEPHPFVLDAGVPPTPSIAPAASVEPPPVGSAVVPPPTPEAKKGCAVGERGAVEGWVAGLCVVVGASLLLGRRRAQRGGEPSRA